MAEPLFEFLRDPAPLSLPELVLGNVVLALLGAATLVSLAAPLLSMFARVVHVLRRGMPGAWRVGVREVGERARPLQLDALSPALARLALDTRTLALELRRRSGEAARWPDDVDELELVRVPWWSALIGEPATPLLDTRRDVFDWLDGIAGLPASERALLSELGIDTEQVRAVLTANLPALECMRTLAGLLWTIDERLGAAQAPGYRASQPNQAPAHAELSLGSSDEHDDEATTRRRHFQRLAGSRRLSRIAASYAHGTAEREDLEQDIALALWQALPRHRGESTLDTFAARIAQYCGYRHLRRRAKQRSDIHELALLADPEPSAEALLLHDDELARVEQARASLPDTLAAPLQLQLAGHSQAEIAARLGITEQNVSVRLTRARHKLRTMLAT